MADGDVTYDHLQAPELIWMMLHRTRHLFVRQRTMPINALGAHLRHCNQRHLQSTSSAIDVKPHLPRYMEYCHCYENHPRLLGASFLTQAIHRFYISIGGQLAELMIEDLVRRPPLRFLELAQHRQRLRDRRAGDRQPLNVGFVPLHYHSDEFGGIACAHQVS